MNLHPPPQFLPVPGKPSVPWEEWYLLFETYLTACGGDSFPSERKVSILLNCLGAEGQKQYRHLPDISTQRSTGSATTSPQPGAASAGDTAPPHDPYVVAVIKLRTRFTTSVNRTAERYKFRSRAQFAEETVDEYVSALTELASTCSFGSLTEEMICDQFVEKTDRREIRDRLLLEPSLTLDSALVIGRQVEEAIRESALLSSRVHSSQVAAIRKNDSTPVKTKCFRCGSAKHKANNPSCPAKDKICRKCRKKGHFESVCRSSTKQRKMVRELDASVFAVTSATPSAIFCQVEVDHILLRMLVDTGSSVSLLPITLYKQYFKHLPLEHSAVKLKSYSHEVIPVHGTFTALVSFAKRSKACTFYVVKSGTPILGIDALHALDIKLDVAQLRCSRVQAESDDSMEFTVKTSVIPVQQKLRRLPLEVRQKVSEELQKLEQADIIERVDASEWVSPIVVLWKRTGELRLCVDLRKPNEAIIVDSHPLPHGLLWPGLGGSSFPENVIYCQGCEGTIHYLDDILVFGKNRRDHDNNLRMVLQRLESSLLRLNKKKCIFGVQEVQFLGHRIVNGTLKPSQDTLEAIIEAPSPQTISALRSFLGLASYYLKFIPHFSSVTEPLRRLLRNGVPFTWTSEQQDAFKSVKLLMRDCIPLALFDSSLPTVVTTDASNCGLGAVLQQQHPEGLRTVCFASRSLSSTEEAYSTGEKEALACLWACEKWHIYLFGRRFLLRTEHQALVTLLSTQGYGRQTMRIARWAARLLQYNYEIQYKKGQDNTVADALSRMLLSNTEKAPCASPDESELVCYVQQLQLSPLTLSELQDSTGNDPVMTNLLKLCTTSWPSAAREDKNLAPYYCVREELSTIQGIVTRGEKVVPPAALRKRIISLGHESHPGIVRTKQRIRMRYWWPKMDLEIEEYVRACHIYSAADKTAVTRHAPLQPVPFPSGPWKQVGIDLVGPFSNLPSGCRLAITAVDYYSKWPEVKMTPKVTTDTVIAFLRQLFAREGYPNIIVSDHGSQFQSHAFKSFLQDRGIQHRQSSVYYPHSNGQIERFNRVLKDFILLSASEQGTILRDLPEFLGIYRSTPHAATQLSPAELLHGRRMRTRLDVVGFPCLEGNIMTRNDQAADEGQRLSKAYEAELRLTKQG
ncbi:uncharacterized protein LOC135384417 [Ornithodoros turicata]|uniref:uncharacterized protein LOC135384417 n=1 Tax=Ornithodoros turicata TaxID=34597 RepID=UPI003139A143